MRSPIDVFAEGARDGVYPGAQLAASRECRRLVTASVGVLGPGRGATDNETVYDLASLTKPLATAILVGRAVERGLCRWDDPIARFVPNVDPEITIESALDHSSGLPAHARFDRVLPPSLTPGSWDAWRWIVAQATALPRERPVGASAVYSDVGYILLGAALEVIYGKPLSSAFALLGTPLTFRDRRGPPALPLVSLYGDVAPTEGCAPGEVHDENARAMGAAAGHAGLFGTAVGVLKVAENLVLSYHGWEKGLLRPDTVRTMWAPRSVRDSAFTLGWELPSAEASSTGGRWPSTSIGHLGFTGCSLWIEPERALVVVLLSNRVCPTRANNMIRRLRPTLYDAAWREWAEESASRPVSATPVPPRRGETVRVSRPGSGGRTPR